MSFDIDFEFHAPQFIESLENATSIDDGADNFFDALESLEVQGKSNLCNGEFEKPEPQESKNLLKENSIVKIEVKPSDKTQEDIENRCALRKDERDEDTTKRLSLKRKASPLKDRNESVLTNTVQKEPHKKKFAQLLPTIAESPVLLTKERVRPKPSNSSEQRLILKPLRTKKNIGICLKPLPKPPTVPQPFCLTEPGKNTHSCIQDNTDKSSCILTPDKRPFKKKRLEVSQNRTNLVLKPNASEFSFYERDKEIMRRKQERMNSATKELEENVFAFKARPVPKSNRSISSTYFSKRSLIDSSVKEELEENEFSFKARPAPKSNWSFNTTSSSKRSHIDSSIDEVPKHEFKAKEPTVLKKDPFWPEIETRFVKIGDAPALATEKRAEEKKTLMEEKKKKKEELEKALYERAIQAEREFIRELRKAREFKATNIKK